MDYRVRGLDADPFLHLYGCSDAALGRLGVRRLLVDRTPGFPDRIGLRDAEPGERVLLLNFEHQPADTAYRASHAIFVVEGATTADDAVNVVPDVLRRRPISLRAFDGRGEMVEADLVDGDGLAPVIRRFLAQADVAYLHAHYAKPGCYAARIERA